MGIIMTAVGLGGAAAHYGAMYQILAHALTKSLCFFAAGAVLMITATRDIGSVKGLMRASPLAGSALILGGLAIAGAPPFAVFLGEFSILRAGINQGHYLAVTLLAVFLAVAFFGILLHVNRMTLGRSEVAIGGTARIPWTCSLTLFVAAIPVIVFGLYVPNTLHQLLIRAAAIIGG
jgi:hydrogenase-4 component F